LIDATTGHHIWSERYDREQKEIFAIQDDITLEITKALRVKFTVGEQARLWAKSSTTNLAAWEKYVQAADYVFRFSKEDNAIARRLLEEAIVLDPMYADAYVGLSTTHFFDARFGWVESRAESVKIALKYAQKALELNDTLDSAYIMIGGVYFLQGLYEKAIAEGERAVALNPNGALSYSCLAGWVGCSGRWDESVELAKKSLRLQPFPPASYYHWLGRAYFMTGRLDESITTFKKALHVNPNYLPAHAFLAACYSSSNRQAEAESAAKEVLRINPKFTLESYAKTLPYKNKVDIERYVAALRKAGLPEHPPLSLPDKPSIAVLPFDNLSKDPEQEYFADGMTDDLITDLSKISGLFIIARNSTFQYKGKAVDVKKVSRELGIRYVLEGSVRRVGDKVRINAQLIDATTGGHLWAERYDGQMDDVFSLQDKVTQKIVSALAVKLTKGEQERSARKETDKILAYDTLLKGWEHYRRFTPDDFAKARIYFEKAIDIDSDYTRAHAALAQTYWLGSQLGWRWQMGLDVGWSEGRLLARKHMIKAMEKPTSLAHQVASWMNIYRHMYHEAITDAKQAITLDPNDHRAHWMMSWALIFSGNPDEAVEYANTAIRLDPHYTAPNLYLLGLAHFSMGKLEDAVVLMERAFAHNVELVGFSAPLAAAYSLLGQDEAAEIAMENYRNEWPWWGMSPNLQKVMQFFPFKDIDVSDRLADGLVKAGLHGQPSGYYKVSKKYQLSGEEINTLTFGRTVTGISPFKPLVWRIHRTLNGEMTYQGNWPFSMMTPGESGSGKSWIEGDLLCDQWEYIFQGIKYCMTVYENPEGTSKEKNQYLFVTDFGIFPWSPAD
jgi:TolB-like protein/predicted Zn-dependent protease